MAQRHDSICEIRGLGAMVAVELCRGGDRASRSRNSPRPSRRSGEAGPHPPTCGTYGNVIRILVPLTASDALVDEGLAILSAA